ncbi:MAG: NADH-quinone oxidoreductase subunit NuoK [Candidatus Melainabacteria bacterium]
MMNLLTDVGLEHYLIVAGLIFSIGLLGVMTSRNIIRVLICVELMLNAVNINLVAFNNYVQPENMSGQVFAIFVLTVSAAEAAVGLAIVIALYRLRATVDVDDMALLQG